MIVALRRKERKTCKEIVRRSNMRSQRMEGWVGRCPNKMETYKE
jgi:hypothetical protein